jgi:hypothetical protein
MGSASNCRSGPGGVGTPGAGGMSRCEELVQRFWGPVVIAAWAWENGLAGPAPRE